MVTAIYGDTIQCAKIYCPHQEEILCSLGLKRSAGVLFGNRAIPFFRPGSVHGGSAS